MKSVLNFLFSLLLGALAIAVTFGGFWAFIWGIAWLIRVVPWTADAGLWLLGALSALMFVGWSWETGEKMRGRRNWSD